MTGPCCLLHLWGRRGWCRCLGVLLGAVGRAFAQGQPHSHRQPHPCTAQPLAMLQRTPLKPLSLSRSLWRPAGDNIVWTSWAVYADFEGLIKHAR